MRIRKYGHTWHFATTKTTRFAIPTSRFALWSDAAFISVACSLHCPLRAASLHDKLCEFVIIGPLNLSRALVQKWGLVVALKGGTRMGRRVFLVTDYKHRAITKVPGIQLFFLLNNRSQLLPCFVVSINKMLDWSNNKMSENCVDLLEPYLKRIKWTRWEQ